MKLNMFLLTILLVSALVFAADFSGTWVLNSDKSELGEGGGRMAATKLVVTQGENSLKIESTRTGRDGEERTNTEEVTLDGKEIKKSTDRGDTISSAKLDGDALKLWQTRTMSRDGETMEIKSEQTWKLVDGALVVDSKSESPRGERVVKLVYDKK